MKLILIYPDLLKGSNWTGYFYVGVGYLASAVKKCGHDVSLLHVTAKLDTRQFLDAIEQKLNGAKKAVIGFSSTTNMFGFVREWAGLIRKNYSHPVIVGGVHPTLDPEETIQTPGIDAICIGEGEESLVDFLDAVEADKDTTGIGNLWVRHNNLVHKNQLRPCISNLDSLPFPDRSIFNYKNLEQERHGTGVFMASRGCPYNCTYCCNHALRKSLDSTKDYVRFRSIDNLLAEIKEVCQQYPFIKLIHFDDDILPLKQEWFLEFAKRYPREIGLAFECNVRPNLLNESIIQQLKDAGCQTLRIGIESGNSFIRNDILNRQLSEVTIIRAAELCHKWGIRLYTFNMVGLPYEDMSARLETVKFNARINSDEEQISIFYPYKKTKLFDMCQQMGLIQTRDVTNPFRDTSLLFSHRERNQILFVAYYFTILVWLYHFYMRRRPEVAKRLISFTDRLLCSKVFSYALFPLLIGIVRLLMHYPPLEECARRFKHFILRKK
jgi:anaerobic magnesium-protoporphyrin IX monomethyl ester cyclase